MAETYTFVADPDTKECNALVLQHHYSQRLPSAVTYRSGLVDDSGRHPGGVYQAASWAYHEPRAPQNDGFLVDGEFVPRRTCYGRFGTSSRKVVADICEVWGMTFEEHWDAGKHLYWRALTRTGQQWAAELGLQSLPYFKDIA